MISLRRRMAAAVAVLATTGALGPGARPVAAATTADRCYTAALHQVFLGRPAGIYDIEAWIDRYEPAPARPALPRALALSDEWLEAVVVGIYDTALDRAPDDAGLAFWVERLRGGTRVATLTAQVYGSEEVWDRAGGTAEGFVSDVFGRIMGRAPSPEDVGYWAGEVPIRGRGGVARALIGSIENRRDRVTALYDTILGRAPDTAGRDYWAGRLATLDDVQLAVHLASSPEAHARAQVGCEVPPPATTTRMTSGDRSSLTPQISADGRWVAFVSRARDLVPGDVQDDATDLFLWDRQTDELTKVTETDQDVGGLSMSADGRHLAFSTPASNLVPDGGSGQPHVYTWDRTTDTVTRITDGNAASRHPSLSADGRFVAFTSTATDLVPGVDRNGFQSDVFLWDRTTGTTARVTDGRGAAYGATISDDGGLVAFSTDLPPDGGPGPATGDRIHLWHRSDGSFTTVAEGSDAYGITDDGDVLYGRLNGLRLWDAQSGSVTVLVRSEMAGAGADITPDGATVTYAANDPDADTGNPLGRWDVFVWERATGTVLRLSDEDATSARPTTSADGRYVVYHSSPPAGPTAWADVVAWDRGS